MKVSMQSKILFLICGSLICFSIAKSQPSDTLDLQGMWKIAMDGNFKDWPQKVGVEQEWYKSELPSNKSLYLLNQIYFKNAEFQVNDWINLPGSTDEARIGAVLKESQTYSPGLERVYTFDGAFWVQRKINIPKLWEGKSVTLFLERTLGASTVFWDDMKVGEDYGLAFPHRITIDKSIQSGEHTLTVLINKEDMRYAHFGHHGYGGNGSSWNGIVGKIELIAKNATAQIANVIVYPQINSESIDVKLSYSSESDLKNTKVNFLLRKKGDVEFKMIKTEQNINNLFETSITMPKPVLLWSEFTPVVYELKCELESNGKTIDSYSTTFGMREIGKKDGYITINGNKVFMRGTLDCGSFPLTGYPYMQKEKWVEIMKIIKSYGLNHVRYHTWCPPEAAFDAADEVGLYLQPELAGVPYAEINRILDTYGNHPSFCMVSLNNEVMGATEVNEKIVAEAKIKDSRHLYSSTSHPIGNNRNDDFFVSAWGLEKTKEWPYAKRIVGITWGGGDVVHSSRFNLFPPETYTTFSTEIEGLSAPVLAHEMGQWAMFPNFNEIPKYEKGVLRNTNYERIKKQIEKKGLLPLNEQFAKASGKFSAILYKEEMESVMRTPGYAGFQLLDLHDYQGQYISIVGILTDFWESKGLVTPQQHSQYCNSVVPLAKMKKRVWQNHEVFDAEVVISNFSFENIENVEPIWTLTNENHDIIAKGKLNSGTISSGKLTPCSPVQFSLKGIKQASKLLLTIELPGLNIQNNWEIWVYPKKESIDNQNVIVLEAKDLEKAEELLKQGKSVLLMVDSTNLNNYRESCFSTIFWNSIHKWPQKAHTMGILCNPQHPALKKFPTEFHSNWQWWDIAMYAKAMNISDLPHEVVPVIQVIDSYIINEKLAYLWECKVGNGKLMVSSINFNQSMEQRPSARQLKKSIIEYMSSEAFNPDVELKYSEILPLLIKN
jgi:hypothetical protein